MFVSTLSFVHPDKSLFAVQQNDRRGCPAVVGKIVGVAYLPVMPMV